MPRRSRSSDPCGTVLLLLVTGVSCCKVRALYTVEWLLFFTEYTNTKVTIEYNAEEIEYSNIMHLRLVSYCLGNKIVTEIQHNGKTIRGEKIILLVFEGMADISYSKSLATLAPACSSC